MLFKIRVCVVIGCLKGVHYTCFCIQISISTVLSIEHIDCTTHLFHPLPLAPQRLLLKPIHFLPHVVQVLFNLANQYLANKMYTEALNTYLLIVKNKLFNNGGMNRLLKNCFLF